MSWRDAESHALQEWLRQLSYPAQLQPEELQRFLTPNLRSVWRHLKTFVKPVWSAETIRKNLLLAKLQRENIEPNQISHFNIQSREELMLINRVSDIQREIDLRKIERKAIDEEIKNLTCKITEKKYNIISKKNKRQEMADKISLMNLKLAKLKQDIENLDEDHSKAKLLKMPGLNMEVSSNTPNLATRLLNYTQLDISCEEDKKLLLSVSKEFPVKYLYQAFLLASDSVYKSLKCFTANLEFLEEGNKEDLSSNGTLSFSHHLKQLNSLIIHNQLTIVDYIEKVNNESAMLNEEKKALINLIKEMCAITQVSFGRKSIIESEEFVEKLVGNTMSSTKSTLLKDQIVELEADCSEYDSLKQLVEKDRKEDNELQKEVCNKVSLINKLYSKTYKYNSKIDEVRTQIIQMCNKSVLTFLTEMQKQKCLENVILDSEHIIIDEIQMFCSIPLCALTRRWENMNELLPRELIEELWSNPELRVFLLQSEPQNVLRSILEQKWWLCNLIDFNS